MNHKDVTIWLPTDPPRPAPFLLTLGEVACLLRFKCKEPERAVRKLIVRAGKCLRRSGKHSVLPLTDAIELMNELPKWESNRDDSKFDDGREPD